MSRLASALLLAGSLVACGDDAGPMGPSLPTGPVLIEQSGPVAISILEATPPVGSTLTGCGPRISGCVDRVRIRFSMRAPEAGTVLYVAAFLHATNLRACLLGRTDGFTFGAGETRVVEVVFDSADDCQVPLTVATLAVVVEGTVQVASRRAWTLAYGFSP